MGYILTAKAASIAGSSSHHLLRGKKGVHPLDGSVPSKPRHLPFGITPRIHLDGSYGLIERDLSIQVIEDLTVSHRLQGIVGTERQHTAYLIHQPRCYHSIDT